MTANPKKAKVEIKTLEDKVYKNGFIFVRGEIKEINKYFIEQQLDYELDEDNLEGVCVSKGADSYIAVLENRAGLIVHECIHAAQYAMDYRGIDTGNDNTEITAYLTQWLFEESVEFFLEYFIKDKKGKNQ